VQKRLVSVLNTKIEDRRRMVATLLAQSMTEREIAKKLKEQRS